jgi:hypothetical protein
MQDTTCPYTLCPLIEHSIKLVHEEDYVLLKSTGV